MKTQSGNMVTFSPVQPPYRRLVAVGTKQQRQNRKSRLFGRFLLFLSVVESDCISGLAKELNRATGQGTWSLFLAAQLGSTCRSRVLY